MYEILGICILVEAFILNMDDPLAEMVSTLGNLPHRWWYNWQKRPEYFLDDGTPNPHFKGIMYPTKRPLKERLWSMGRGETPDTCEFSLEEMRELEASLLAMMEYEPSKKITADEIMHSKFIVGCQHLVIQEP